MAAIFQCQAKKTEETEAMEVIRLQGRPRGLVLRPDPAPPRSLAEMIQRQGHATQIVGETATEMLEIWATQYATPLCFSQFNSAIDFVGLDREISLEVDAKLRKALS